MNNKVLAFVKTRQNTVTWVLVLLLSHNTKVHHEKHLVLLEQLLSSSFITSKWPTVTGDAHRDRKWNSGWLKWTNFKRIISHFTQTTWEWLTREGLNGKNVPDKGDAGEWKHGKPNDKWTAELCDATLHFIYSCCYARLLSPLIKIPKGLRGFVSPTHLIKSTLKLQFLKILV